MLLIRLIDKSSIFEKVIFFTAGRPAKEIIKINLSLYISKENLIKFISQWVDKNSRLQKNGEKVSGNLDISIIPKSFEKLKIIKSANNEYVISHFGISLNLEKCEGNLEVKYICENGNRELVLNFHIHKDKKKRRKFVDYNKILHKQIKLSIQSLQNNLSSMENLDIKCFRKSEFRLAFSSIPYFINLMLFNYWITRGAHKQEVERKQQFFREEVDKATNLKSFLLYEEEGHIGSAQLEVGHYLYDSKIEGNLAFLDLTQYKSFFSSIKEEILEEVEDYSGYNELTGRFPSKGYYTEENIVNLEMNDFIFVEANIQGLDCSEATFISCDFTNADLRGAKVDIEKMDEATIVTLSRAKLSLELKIKVDDYLKKNQAKYPNFFTTLRDKLDAEQPLRTKNVFHQT